MAVTPLEKVAIVGCGPGAPEYLTGAARRAIEQASVLAGAAHLLERYATPAHERIPVGADIEGALERIAARRAGGKIALLVSGDPGLCSLAGPAIRRFGRASCEVIPGISSVQLAFARAGLEWLDARIISAHKELPTVTPEELKGFKSLAVLCGHRLAREWVAGLAAALGAGCSLVVCEDLSMANEKVRRVPLAEFQRLELSSRTIVLLIKEEQP